MSWDLKKVKECSFCAQQPFLLCGQMLVLFNDVVLILEVLIKEHDALKPNISQRLVGNFLIPIVLIIARTCK